MEKYLENVIRQFKHANNIRGVDSNSSGFKSEFNAWLNERKTHEDEYLKFLYYMELYSISDSKTSEIGKGTFDTIVKDFDTTIITPYSKGIILSDMSRIINANFKVCENEPILERIEKGNIQVNPINSPTPLTFMTQNPYTPDLIDNWEQLHNSQKHNILVGIYGSIYDKDIKTKTSQLEEFIQKLNKPYNEEHTVIGDTYCYAVASENKVKRYGK